MPDWLWWTLYGYAGGFVLSFGLVLLFTLGQRVGGSEPVIEALKVAALWPWYAVRGLLWLL